MVTQTPNHDLDDYEPGNDTSWDHSDLVQLCEDRLVLWNSTDGSKTAYTAHSGAVYIDDGQDPAVLYTGDGSNWVRVGEIASDVATQAELDSQTHPLEDVEQSGATLNQVPKWNGSQWVAADVDATFSSTGGYGTGLWTSGGWGQ